MKIVQFFFFFWFGFTICQNNKIDSLKLVLESKIKLDTSRVNTLNSLATEIFQNKKKKAIFLLDEAIKLSDSLDYKDGKNESLYVLGKTLTAQMKLDSAEVVINQSIKGFGLRNNTFGVIKSTNQLGVIYFFRNNNEKALEYFYKALNYNENVKDNIFYANVFTNIGLICYNQKKFDKALQYYHKSLNIQQKLGESKSLAILYINIGIIYDEQKDYTKSLKFYKKSLDISLKNDDQYLIAYNYFNLGSFYEEMKQYKKALYYFFKALKIHKEIKNKVGVSYSYNGISNVYIKQKKYDKALKYIFINSENVKKYKLLRHQVEIDKMLSIIYENKKVYNKALYHYQLYKQEYDSINSIDASNRFADLEAKYKFKEKELLSKEEELKLKSKIEKANSILNKKNKQFLYGYIVFLIVIVIFIFIVYYSRNIRLTSEYQKLILEQKLLHSQMKPHFVFNSLAVLQGIVLHKDYIKANNYLSNFSRLLRKILESSREEFIDLKTELSIIENYISLIKMSDKRNHCDFNLEIGQNVDVDKILVPPLIIQPIVENSFEHGFDEIDKNYTLTIHIEFINSELICTILDNGKGFDNLNVKEIASKQSLSTKIIVERLKLFSRSFKKSFSIKSINREGGNEGAKVVLILPYKLKKK